MKENDAPETFLAEAERSYGQPSFNRRLTDKVLAAFNHAYSTGERDIARQLRHVLEEVERKLRSLGHRPRTGGVLYEADRWVHFIDARDRYKAARDDPRFAPEAVGEALEEMKEAFRIWSLN